MRTWGPRCGPLLLCLLLSGSPWPAGAAEQAAEPAAAEATADASPDAADAAAAPGPAPARRAARSPISRRVELLARELRLDARQQLAVTKILEQQRADVAKVWEDASVSAALRIGATQAIGDKTADRIRAILNDEQRKKYIQPRQHEAPVGAPGGDVQKWMQTAQGLEPPVSGAAPHAVQGN